MRLIAGFCFSLFSSLTLVEVVTLKRYMSVLIAIGSLKIQNSNIADGEHHIIHLAHALKAINQATDSKLPRHAMLLLNI
jgi:hypothetical protein